ncbi:hypothetical protein ACFTXV_26410, partial [Streptomyces harbinensis]
MVADQTVLDGIGRIQAALESGQDAAKSAVTNELRLMRQNLRENGDKLAGAGRDIQLAMKADLESELRNVAEQVAALHQKIEALAAVPAVPVTALPDSAAASRPELPVVADTAGGAPAGLGLPAGSIPGPRPAADDTGDAHPDPADEAETAQPPRQEAPADLAELLRAAVRDELGPLRDAVAGQQQEIAQIRTALEQLATQPPAAPPQRRSRVCGPAT